MTEKKKETCPICRLSNEQINIMGTGFPNIIMRVNCPRCGEFNCPELFLLTAFNKPEPKISAWIRDLNEQKVEVPTIDSNKLKDLKADLPEKSPREKQKKLLRNIERKTEYPGKAVRIDPEFDIPLAWASAQEEFIHYMESLFERGLLRNMGKKGFTFRQSSSGSPIYDRPLAFSVEITADGWDYLEKQEQQIEERTQAFVAMSFSKDLRPIYEGPIKNAIEKAGYKAFRVDAEPHIDRIDAKIMAAIKDSRFVVADVTQHKRGVYFEAGYAMGLGLPVLWCVKKRDSKKVHFDTRQYNHIIWEEPEDLENKLYDFICWIIGKGKGT